MKCWHGYTGVSVRINQVKQQSTCSSGVSAEMSSTIVLSFARISVCLKDSLAFFSSSSNEMTIYSTYHGRHLRRRPIINTELTSSPQSNSSPCRSFNRSQICRNCVIPWSLTWSACFFASSQASGVPRYKRPIFQCRIQKEVVDLDHTGL